MADTIRRMALSTAITEVGRRYFLYSITASMAGVEAVTAAWPFINGMNPSNDVLAEASIDIDIRPIQEGQRTTLGF